MTEDVKKNVWSLDVKRCSVFRVLYEEEVTKSEAIDLYLDENFDDILDEEDHGIDVVGAR